MYQFIGYKGLGERLVINIVMCPWQVIKWCNVTIWISSITIVFHFYHIFGPVLYMAPCYFMFE